MNNIITIKNLTKTYDKGRTKALNNISLNIKEGVFVSIMGPSGSGKSTLLNMIGAAETRDSSSPGRRRPPAVLALLLAGPLAVRALGTRDPILGDHVRRGVLQPAILQPRFLPTRVVDQAVQFKHDFGASLDRRQVVIAELVRDLVELAGLRIVA